MRIKYNAPSLQLLMKYIHLRVNQVADFYRGMHRAYLVRSMLLLFTGALLLPSFGLNKKKYLIGTHRLINAVPNSELKHVVIVGGIREFVLAIKYRIGFINTSWLYISCFYYCFVSTRFRKRYSQSFSGLVKLISKMDQPALLLTDSDALPYPRSICLAAQQTNAKVVCIQHGIFHYPFAGIDGSLSDLNLAMGDKQRELLIDSGISSNRVALLESVMVTSGISRQESNTQERRVILVGEGWYSHDRTIHDSYEKALVIIKQELNDKGIRVLFRPHPAERYAIWRFIKLFPLILAQRSKGVSKNDIYIGATSTLLVQAVSVGAQSIQISDVIEMGASFEDYGVYHCPVNEVARKVFALLEDTAIPTEYECISNATQEIAVDKIFNLLI